MKPTFKKYARVYCEAGNEETVVELLKEFEPTEYEYIPDGFVTCVEDYPKAIYAGKLELDLIAFNTYALMNGIAVSFVITDERGLGVRDTVRGGSIESTGKGYYPAMNPHEYYYFDE